jgi:hypothetical protein
MVYDLTGPLVAVSMKNGEAKKEPIVVARKKFVFHETSMKLACNVV